MTAQPAISSKKRQTEFSTYQKCGDRIQRLQYIQTMILQNVSGNR
jgi:hypothetical protein